MDYLSISWEQARTVVEEYWPNQLRMPHCRFYLYYLPSRDGQPGQVKALRDGDPVPEGFILAMPEALPRHQTKTQVVALVQSVIRQLPILSV